MFIVSFPFDRAPALISCLFFPPLNTAIKRLQIQKYKEGEEEKEAFLSGCEKRERRFPINVSIYARIKVYMYIIHTYGIYKYIKNTHGEDIYRLFCTAVSFWNQIAINCSQI